MNVKLRSPLEERAWARLVEEDIDFTYEPVSIILSPQTSYPGESYEGRGRSLVKTRSLVLPITYKPDFVGINWIMEIKGHRRPDFDLRWKLFKALLAELNAPYTLLMPRNHKQLEEAINIIKQKKGDGQDKGLLQEQENLQQLLVGVSKPKVSKTTTGG